MKRLQVSRDIVALGDFKAHASQWLRHVKGSNRPVVITQNGKPAAVLLTPVEFDRLCDRAAFVRSVEEGLADADAGRTIGDRDLERLLDRELGPRE